MLSVDSRSIWTMRSKRLIPARLAGVDGIGRMTVRTPSRTEMTMPRPPKAPLVCMFISRYASGERNVECGSSVCSIPLQAAYSTSQYVDDPMATESLMREERRAGTSNAVLARRAHELGLVRDDDAPDRRSQADEAQALVGAVTLDGGTRAGLDVAAAVLGRKFAPGPVDCAS